MSNADVVIVTVLPRSFPGQEVFNVLNNELCPPRLECGSCPGPCALGDIVPDSTFRSSLFFEGLDLCSKVMPNFVMQVVGFTERRDHRGWKRARGGGRMTLRAGLQEHEPHARS